MLKLFNRKKKDNKGFTLVELVIVVAILAILVGLLAPQYTKYVEKTRTSADASNMDEMVKVIKVYAADPANELAAGAYTIKISDTTSEGDTTTITCNPNTLNKSGLEDELTASIPSWKTTTTKSKKWGVDGASAPISATVTVGEDGGTSVQYFTGASHTAGNKFEKYMETGAEK